LTRYSSRRCVMRAEAVAKGISQRTSAPKGIKTKPKTQRHLPPEKLAHHFALVYGRRASCRRRAETLAEITTGPIKRPGTKSGSVP
jgi:hypothetical protein